ncbi:holliday junction ATP-dependent DNA helicase RuvB [Ahrensia sp. R2A130]|nr:holliday junction ATP-dependent DNA helicase RuvB [Ahrensia sp. R2A130]
MLGSNFFDAERKLLNDVIDEVDGSELEAPNLLSLIISKRESLHVHLDMVAPWSIQESAGCSAWCGPFEDGYREVVD